MKSRALLCDGDCTSPSMFLTKFQIIQSNTTRAKTDLFIYYRHTDKICEAKLAKTLLLKKLQTLLNIHQRFRICT